MDLEFSLSLLPIPRITAALLRGPSAILQKIAQKNIDRFEQDTESKLFKNRKEELILRLQRLQLTGESFDQATSVVGRERLLLSLYLEYFGQAAAQSWLPVFDNTIALSILGNDGARWHQRMRRRAVMLFFTYFDQLKALPFLCSRITESYASAKVGSAGVGPTRQWSEYSKTIFTPAGHENVAKQVKTAENLVQLVARFGVPETGRFSEKLRQVFLLNGITNAPFGKATGIFEDVATLKNEHAPDNLLMGAAALKILISRVINEGGRKWAGDWPDWISRFGCDPRHGRATAQGTRWWGWATDAELRLAQQGITGLTLRFFIEFLRNSLVGTEKEVQFALRSRFLLALFESGKIQNARLVLNSSALQRLDSKFRDPWTVANLSATTDQTSMICLRCTDDIYIIEGTHSFGLRMFHREFPIRGFWDHPKKTYQDRELRISPSLCSVFLRHDPSGKWVGNFFTAIRSKFHREWSDVRI